MLIANKILARALEDSKTGASDAAGNPVGMVAAAQDHLNAILSDLCMSRDLAIARGLYTFTLSPTQTSTLNGVTNFGGPYPLPMDYLRASGSSGSDGYQTGFWYFFQQQGNLSQPMPLKPLDLGRYDMLVQLPNPSLPTLYTTDISPEQTANDRIVLQTTAAVTINTNTITLSASPPTSLATGMGAAGQGIAPGSTITNIAGSVLTLSLNATATVAAASVFFGIQPNAYIWPQSNGAYPAFLRYQRRMPNITDFTRMPWFELDGYLIDELASRLMAQSGDDRRRARHQEAEERLTDYLKLSDDKTDRAQTVILDTNRFNVGTSSWSNKPQTKQIGWP